MNNDTKISDLTVGEFKKLLAESSPRLVVHQLKPLVSKPVKRKTAAKKEVKKTVRKAAAKK